MYKQFILLKCILFVIFCNICLFATHDITLAVEPIATIGQPYPMKHAFLGNETLLRVVPNRIQIVNINTGEAFDEFAELNYLDEVIFSPNSPHLAILKHSYATQMSTVEIWDTNAQEKISVLDVDSQISQTGAFSTTAPLFVYFVDDKPYIWHWKTDEKPIMMEGLRRKIEPCYVYDNGGRVCNNSNINFPVFTADGKYLIIGSKRPDIELWNVETRKIEGHFVGHIGNWVDGVVISPNGKLMASFDRGASVIYMWDVESRHLLWKAKSGIGKTKNIIFSPDSERLYVGSTTQRLWQHENKPLEGWDDSVRVFSTQSGEMIDIYSTEFHNLLSIALSPDGDKLLIQYLDAVLLWDIKKKQQNFVWTDFAVPQYPDLTKISLDGKTVISVSPHYIKTWDVATQQMQRLISAEDYEFSGLVFSPDNQTYAVSKSPWLEIRNIQTGKVEKRFETIYGSAEQIRFSKSGEWFSMVNDWGYFLLLNTEKQDKFMRITTNIDNDIPRFHHIAFSNDEKYMAATCQTNNNSLKYWIMMWKQEEGIYVFQYAHQVQRLYSAPAFTTKKDGTSVLAAYGDWNIYFWEVGINQLIPITTLGGHNLQFSPDGRYLFTNHEGYLQIYDWQTSKPVKHKSYHWYVSLSQNSSVMMSRAYEGTHQYLIWDLTDIISDLPYSVEPKNKKFVTLGQIKRNQLLQNFPNPFNPETWIPFRLADKRTVTIRIYTPTGNLIRTLSPGVMAAGDYSSQSKAIHWDGRNEKGEMVSSGIYLYTINAGNYSDTRKMIIKK